MQSMNFRTRLLLCFCGLFCTALTACNRFDPDDPPVTSGGGGTGGGGVGVTSQLNVEEPQFGGITDLVPGSGTLYLAWEAGSDNIDAASDLRYRIYTATERGTHDFTSPILETSAGALSATLTGLVDGVALYVVVRAVDTEGRTDANLAEWIATPNPVRYIDAASVAGAPDGLTPQSAYRTIGQAVGANTAIGGVNFLVATGTYTENVFLFDGMCLFGGFGDDWLPESRDLATEASTLTTPFSVDLVTVLPGSTLTGLDGFVLEGNGVASTGVTVDDAMVRMTQLEIRNPVSQGVDLRSDFADGGMTTGILAGTRITGCGGEGVLLSGIFDFVIDNNTIANCTTEGIESQWIYALAGERTELRVTRNVIRDNGDEGVDLDVAEISELDPT